MARIPQWMFYLLAMIFDVLTIVLSSIFLIESAGGISRCVPTYPNQDTGKCSPISKNVLSPQDVSANRWLLRCSSQFLIFSKAVLRWVGIHCCPHRYAHGTTYLRSPSEITYRFAAANVMNLILYRNSVEHPEQVALPGLPPRTSD